MPLTLAPLIAFALGAALAWATGGREDGPGGRLFTRPTALVAWFAALVFAPVHAYFLVFAGDWSLGYLIDARAVPSAVLLVAVVADAALVVGAFSIARRLAAARAFGGLAALAGVPTVAILVAAALLYPRLRVDASYAQFHGDFGTRSVAGGRLGLALLWMDALLAAGAALTARGLLAGARAGRKSAGHRPAGTRLLGSRAD